MDADGTPLSVLTVAVIPRMLAIMPGVPRRTAHASLWIPIVIAGVWTLTVTVTLRMLIVSALPNATRR